MKRDEGFTEYFEFRNVKAGEEDEAVEIEQICFRPNEACSEKSMKERMSVAADLFFVAVDRESGRIAGFLNGIATDEEIFRDEFFTDASLHRDNGKNVMLLGLDVRPEYRHRGLAHEIMDRYLKREREKGRKAVILTCLEEKVEFYRNMGFCDLGLAGSSWGGEVWHEMSCIVNK